MNGRSWVGKKGRTLKDNGCTGVKHHPYAYSDMIPELNSITSLFIEKQKHMAESTGFKLFAKPLHPYLFDKQFQVWLMPKVDTMGRTIAANGGRRLMIFQEDVSAVFGTPSTGKEVYDASLDDLLFCSPRRIEPHRPICCTSYYTCRTTLATCRKSSSKT
jgi:hypothetical protein